MTAAAVSRVPVVLPVVDATINADGLANVTVDRMPYGDARPVGRDALEGILREIAGSLGPVRVRVTEADGSEFTDVVLPEPDSSATTDAPQEPAAGLAGDGFLPDEAVDVAVIVAHRKADGNGRAQLRLPPALLARHASTVVLIGRTSGRVLSCESS